MHKSAILSKFKNKIIEFLVGDYANDCSKQLSMFLHSKGKYVNGTTLIVDGGLWLSRPRHLPKDAVKQLSRTVEKRSRDKPIGVPKSKL